MFTFQYVNINECCYSRSKPNLYVKLVLLVSRRVVAYTDNCRDGETIHVAYSIRFLFVFIETNAFDCMRERVDLDWDEFGSVVQSEIDLMYLFYEALVQRCEKRFFLNNCSVR
ncbi:conserved hypothetical protein [Trichinella spiralis]|uniref:hypothetical protein n=1 Tax=Trichinella spiralis TaxID=6334 RepID=UPI0001EFD154|nr:conserved hypothetical protein [Trichinella spiralis]